MQALTPFSLTTTHTQTEVVKGEGITFSEELNKVYLALTRFKTSALAGSTTGTPWQYDLIGHDDIRLPDNACGGILEMDVTSTTNWRPTHGRIILAGVPQTADLLGNTCNVNNIASPDNLIMMPGTSQLFIQEDCDDHTNCVGWLLDLLQKAPYAPWPANPVITRIISSPREAEITGAWPATIGAYTYVSMGMQHAAASPSAFVGYVGPVPNSLLGPRPGFTPNTVGALRRWIFDEIPSQTGTAGQDLPISSNNICIV